MEVIYTLAGIVLMVFTCLITWINWRILRVSEDLLEISEVLLDETIKVRKKITPRTKSTKVLNKPISGTKIK